MKAEKIRALSAHEQENKLNELKESLFKFRFQHEIGQLGNTSKLRLMKRDIARIKTLTNQNRNKE
ncbi:MAG: 50S ribosomal protein L29 [Deltaproteobacteria bacterium]|nr:50S ribosomal protein L29 [Deltaproteobacteria bacterium]